jgi:hypothetical protein
MRGRQRDNNAGRRGEQLQAFRGAYSTHAIFLRAAARPPCSPVELQQPAVDTRDAIGLGSPVNNPWVGHKLQRRRDQEGEVQHHAGAGPSARDDRAWSGSSHARWVGGQGREPPPRRTKGRRKKRDSARLRDERPTVSCVLCTYYHGRTIPDGFAPK